MSIGIRRRILALECLEDRTVPAKLVNPTTVVFQDIDGDLAQLVFSKPVLTSSNVNSILGFSIGAVDGSTSTKQSLNTLTLVPLSSGQGNNLSIALSVAKKSKTGDGRVNLGWIISDQKALNTVSIQGDLGSFYLSNAEDLYCLQQLQVQSLGRVGGLNGSQFLDSAVYGKIGTIKVTGNVAGNIRFSVTGSGSGQAVATFDIGGSFFGQLYSSRGMGAMRIGRDIDGSHPELSYLNQFQTPGSMVISGPVGQFTVAGSILGGDQFNSGLVFLGNDTQALSVKTLSIAGNVQAGAGYGSGGLSVTGRVTKLTIGGSILGGPEGFSGRVQTNGTKDAFIGGSVVGGGGEYSGAYNNYTDSFDFVQNTFELKGNIIGGKGDRSGSVTYWGAVKQLTLESVVGGSGEYSGLLTTEVIADQLITKDIVGGEGTRSGQFIVSSGYYDNIRVAKIRNVLGGKGIDSGIIDNNGLISQLVIQNLQGGDGEESGQIRCASRMPSISILGDVLGGQGDYSGNLADIWVIDTFSIGGNIRGGRGYQSGHVRVMGDLDVEIKGNVIGGDGELSGVFNYSQVTESEINYRQFKLGGNVVGGNGLGSGFVLYSGRATTISLGSVLGGAGELSGLVRMDGRINTLSVQDVRGGQGEKSGSFFARPKQLIVRGSIVGGEGLVSGFLSTSDLETTGIEKNGSLQILGSIQGGRGEASGEVESDGTYDVTIVGNIAGGEGLRSGAFHANYNFDGTQTFLMKGDVKGGTGENSGYAEFISNIDSVSLGGVIGGVGKNSGLVQFDANCPRVSLQRVIGGEGDHSGRLYLGNDLVSGFAGNQIRVLDSVIGGSGYFSGSLDLYGQYQFVLVQNAIKGGSNTATGYLEFHGPVAQFTVGSMVGGSGYYSGAAYSSRNVASIRVIQSMTGGSGEYSGSLQFPFSNVTTFAASGNIQGGVGSFSGSIYARSIENSSVGGSILGGNGYAAGGILADTHLGNVYISHDLIGSDTDNGGYVAVAGNEGNRTLDTLWIGGSMNRGLVFSQGTIGSITVKNSITGTALRHSSIEAFGYDQVDGVPYRSYTLGSLTVGKDIEQTNILIGNNGIIPDGVARVGTVNIGRNWIASNIVVGYGAGLDNELGTADDVRLDANRVSSIDSVFIQGMILGLDGASGEAVVQAGLINSMRVGKDKVILNPGPYNDDLLLAELLRVVER